MKQEITLKDGSTFSYYGWEWEGITEIKEPKKFELDSFPIQSVVPNISIVHEINISSNIISKDRLLQISEIASNLDCNEIEIDPIMRKIRFRKTVLETIDFEKKRSEYEMDYDRRYKYYLREKEAFEIWKQSKGK